MKKDERTIAVVGGGLAGLVGATYLAENGYKVRVYEKSIAAGGRARTKEEDGFLFNLGPHALYLKAGGLDVLSDLGIHRGGDISGGRPSHSLYLRYEEKLHTMPITPTSILLSSLFDWKDKMELLKFFIGLSNMKCSEIRGISVTEWMNRNLKRKKVQDYFMTLCRLSTYIAEPSLACAGAILNQLQKALGGVIYPDGGWQTIVNALYRKARAAGAEIVTGQGVQEILFEGEQRSGESSTECRAIGVRLQDGTCISADGVLIATDPKTVRRITGGRIGDSWSQFTPVRVACLDVALRRLPQKDRLVVLGMDSPFYMSVHSAWGQLAPPAGAMIHVAKYMANDEQEGNTKYMLEEYLDSAQAGWRDEVVFQKYLPNLVVSHAIVEHESGFAGRPGPHTSVPNVFISGDWVGDQGMLADAALMSGREAARMLIKVANAQIIVAA